MPLTAKALYKFHVDNLRSVNDALDHVESQLKASLKSGQAQEAKTFLSLYILLIGVWAEGRLRKMLYEPSGFTEPDRTKILNQQNKLDQWKESLELGFRRKHRIGAGQLKSMPKIAFLCFKEMQATLESEMRPIIEIRNKLAHGQWVKPLNNSETEIAKPQLEMLKNENYLKARFRRKIVGHFCDAVHDLVASANAFERDFDKHYRYIEETRDLIANKDYIKWLNAEQAKFIRGKAKRDDSIRNRPVAETP